MLCGNWQTTAGTGSTLRLELSVLLPQEVLRHHPQVHSHFKPESQQVGQTHSLAGCFWHFSCCVVIIYLPASLTCLYIRLQGSGALFKFISSGLASWLALNIVWRYSVTVSTMYSVVHKVPLYVQCLLLISSRHFINIHWLKQEPIQWQQVASSNAEVLENQMDRVGS